MDKFQQSVMEKAIRSIGITLDVETINKYAKHYRTTMNSGTARFSNLVKLLIRKARKLDGMPFEVLKLVQHISPNTRNSKYYTDTVEDVYADAVFTFLSSRGLAKTNTLNKAYND